MTAGGPDPPVVILIAEMHPPGLVVHFRHTTFCLKPSGLENLPGSSSTVLDALGRVAESYVVPGPRSGELCGAGAA